MRTLSISTLITYSIERTALILFKPFSLKKWLCLLFIAWLCGALGGGGFGGDNINIARKKAEAVQLQSVDVHTSGLNRVLSSLQSSAVLAKKYISNKSSYIVVIIVGFIVLFFIGLLVVLVWLGARFKFVWFNAMVTNDASIVEPFKRYHTEGNSFFLFSMVFLSIVIGFFSLIAAWVFAVGRATGVFASPVQWSVMDIVGTFFIPAMVFLVGVVAAAVFSTYIDHFVVTIMALDKCRFKPAWQRFATLFKDNISDFILYIFVLMGLGIVCAIIAFFVALMCIVSLAIAALTIFGTLYLIIVSFLKAKGLFIILAVLLAIPFITITILVLTSINLPFAVFFRSFSLYFLSSLNVGYAPLQLTTSSE